MAEYAGTWDEEMVSAFIVSKCQLRQKSVYTVSDYKHDMLRYLEPAPKEYTTLCGSHAEFYIQLPNTCISDIDFLISRANELACSDDIPVVPSDMSGLAETIECYKIEPYHMYPGFVQLSIFGEMHYNWKYKKYEFKHATLPDRYIALDMPAMSSVQSLSTFSRSRLSNSVRGPAIKAQSDVDDYCGSDTVMSVWCPQWPKEAKNWPIRGRNYRWPTVDTISEVVQKGCHVVYVQHRSCRDDKLQWRLSFSVAEVLLLQSWTKVQQIVYHLLRFFAKRELIEKDCPKEDEILCPYHLKTLMLWTCEEMSPEWWNSSSVIDICCVLLQKLSEWLKRRYCPNYFIPEANLFYVPSNSKMLDKTERRLNKFPNSIILCHWFVENYIKPLTRTNVDVVDTGKNFMNCTHPRFEIQLTSQSKLLDFMSSFRFIKCHAEYRYLIKPRLNPETRLTFQDKYWNLTAEMILCSTYYDNLLYSLHNEYALGSGEISLDNSIFVQFVNAISTQPKLIRSQNHDFPKAYRKQSSRFQFLRAQDLMENLTGSNNRSEFQLVSLISEHFLRKALEYEDSKCNGIAPAALAYLAALHFATSEYQLAIRFCLTVLVEQTSQEDKETLNAGCLFFIDDVASIVGLWVLHKKITNSILYYIDRRLYLDLRLSPEVFAYYLTALSTERLSKGLDLHHELPDSSFPMDEFLKALRKPKCITALKSGIHFSATRQIVYRRTDSLTASIMNPFIVKETVTGVLMEYALKTMRSFYSVIRKDFGIQCNIADCYRALYLYKTRKYNEVMNLCKRILHEPELQSDLKEFAFANVLLLPPLDSFFDGDVQSLLGFHTLLYYLSSLNDVMRKFELTDESTFAHWFAREVDFHGSALSASLMRNYSIKRNYFVGRHFLAKYLKVRCSINCNLPYSEAMTEFAVQKFNLPMELLIRRFILRRFRIVRK